MNALYCLNSEAELSHDFARFCGAGRIITNPLAIALREIVVVVSYLDEFLSCSFNLLPSLEK